jgi:DNA-damage-inducible protein D
MPETDILPFDETGGNFESVGQQNGSRFWYGSAFMALLGYESTPSFMNAVNRAIGTCSTLGIPVAENFQQCDRVIDGQRVSDYKFSRFACYLVAMNGDVRKPQVAAAQAYFANLAEAAQQYIQAAQDVERVMVRDDISEREKSLNSTAKKAGVTEYHFFQNAGYLGMYNMNLGQLKKLKGLPDGRTLLDFMDKRELAGNLFRLTETEARMQAEATRGQRPAEAVASKVGRQVRKMMIDNTGTAPERLPLSSDIKKVRTGLKQTAKEFTKLDSTRSPRRIPQRSEGGE